MWWGPEMHHNGSILCGVAKGRSPELSLVVETKQGQGALELALQANKMVTDAYTSASSGPSSSSRPRYFVLGSPPIAWPTWSNFKAYNWLFSIP